MDRPGVAVVVPFVGSDDELAEVCRRLGMLELSADDSILVVDNRPVGAPAERTVAGIRVINAPAIQSSYHARNMGARASERPWLLFVDADVHISPSLIGDYFVPDPKPETAVLAGEISNEDLSDGGHKRLIERYSHLATLFAQHNTVSRPDFAYAMTANCAIRREAFDAVGGFVETLRSGGDADICFRLRRADWGLESRPHAVVTHINRPTLRALLRQSARHGSGAAWLEARYPGFSRPNQVPLLIAQSVRNLLRAGIATVRGEPDRALVQAVDAGRSVAFELGRRVPNEVDSRGPTASAGPATD